MRKIWKPEEIEFLKKSWGILDLEELIKTLERTEDSITRKARRLNIDTHKKEEDKLIRNWTYDEDQYLLDNYDTMPNKEICKLIQRSLTSVRKRAKILKICHTLNRWSEEDEIYLEEKWGIVNVGTIGKSLNRSKNAVLLKAWNMGLREQSTSNGEYLTPLDVSNITGIPLSTVYSYLRKDKIIHKRFKTGEKRKYQISPKSLLIFLKKYEHDWNIKHADISHIKTYYTQFLIKSNQFTIRDNIPEWLTNKIIRERK